MKVPVSIAPQRMAALFVDFQEEQRSDPRYVVVGFAEIIANAMRIQASARQAGVAVFHSAYVVDVAASDLQPFFPVSDDGRPAFSMKGDPLTEICAEVGPLEGEVVVIKSQASAFGNPMLNAELKARGIEWLLVCGVWTEACIAATVNDAMAAGLRVILVKDACASGSIAMHQTAVLNIANRLYGGAVASTEAVCRIMEGASADLWMVEGSVPFRFTYEDAEQLYQSL